MSDGMQEAIDVLRDISQLRRDLAVYHDTLVAHNILQEHCDNQRKELAALTAAHKPVKDERDSYKKQCGMLARENAILRDSNRGLNEVILAIDAENVSLRDLALDLYVELLNYSKAPHYNVSVWEPRLAKYGIDVSGIEVGDGNQG